jgi:hypothetical protein
LEEERGRIIGLDIKSKKINAELLNIDAIGLCVGGMTGEKRLYFGAARKPEVYSILLNASGEFEGQTQIRNYIRYVGPQG